MSAASPTSWNPRQDLAIPLGAVALVTALVAATVPPARIAGQDACARPDAAGEALSRLLAARWQRGLGVVAFGPDGGWVELEGARHAAGRVVDNAGTRLEWSTEDATRHRLRVHCVVFDGWRVDAGSVEVVLDGETERWLVADDPR